MKKVIVLQTVLIAVLLSISLTIQPTLAFFFDKDVVVGQNVQAGVFQVDVSIELPKYGIPSDVLINTDTKKTDECYVKVTNNSTVPMTYKLILTIDKDTQELIKTLSIGSGTAITGTTVGDNTVYAYYGRLPAYVQGSTNHIATLPLNILIKGTELVDGNAFQKRLISVTPVVEAVQDNAAAITEAWGVTIP